MPCEAPVMTATFLSLLMLVSFILPGHGYSSAGGVGGHFRSNAAAGEDDFQLSDGAMSDRRLRPRRGQPPAPAHARTNPRRRDAGSPGRNGRKERHAVGSERLS